MGSAFAAEPWVRDLPDAVRQELVMHAINLGAGNGRPEWVCHRAHPECRIECPHLFEDCGRYRGAR